jgi:hypothetical protein
MKFFSFGESMKKMIMTKENQFFERSPLLKCVKLQVSNVFSAKLGSFFFLKNVKDVYILENNSKIKLKVCHLDKI